MTKWLLLLHLALVLSSCSGGATSPAFEKLSELTSSDEDQATPPDVTGDGNALRAATVPDEDPLEERGIEAVAGVVEKVTARVNPYLRFRSKQIAPAVDAKAKHTSLAAGDIKGAGADWESVFARLYSSGYEKSTVRAALSNLATTEGKLPASHVDIIAAAYAVYRTEQNVIAAEQFSKLMKQHPWTRTPPSNYRKAAAAPSNGLQLASPSSDRKRTALASIEEHPSPRSVLDLTSPPRARKYSITPFIRDLAKKHDALLEQKRLAKEVKAENLKEMNEAIAWMNGEKSRFQKALKHHDIQPREGPY
ncbi:unnamed protein product [Hyaloperonospora brassicae]|uniref:RxLR effector candidate protein n=1 Tax=Hyaloperonospora brassicae TaxID=162125 RepID=A0AAV0TFV7_HYABA|nr:unnamed protein product [Hyaloperonospora brassicae]